MRKLMWFTIGFGAACAVGIYLLTPGIMLALGGTAIAAAVMLAVFGKKETVRAGSLVSIGIAAAFLWCGIYSFLWMSPIKALDGQICSVTLTAEDYSFDTDYGICVDGIAEISGESCHVRMYVSRQEPLAPGDRVTGEFRLRYTAPGAMEDMTYHSGKGILLLAYPKGEHQVETARGKSFQYCAAYLRADLLTLIEDIFPADTVPFVKALLIGDTSELDYKTDTDLSVSGIRHVAAVSGLHVSILFSVIYLFAGKRRILTAILGIPLLFLFAAMAGFSASILRAGLMQSLMLLAMAVKKEYDPPTALSFAVLVMLVVNPVTVTSVGFQLSVASVSGIFLFSGKIRSWLLDRSPFAKKKSRCSVLYGRMAASVSISLGALITTTPLTALYFGSVNLLSVVTNLLCLWVVTILFCGIIGACLLGAVWHSAGVGIGWILAWFVRYILKIAEWIAGIPFAAVYTESIFVLFWLILCYVFLGLLIFRKKKRPVILGCCAVFLLCMALLLSWTLPLTDHYRVTVLDVGQGQCILLQSGGKTYMVDCGGSYDKGVADTAAEALLSQGIRRLDGLILTHYDKDHVNAAAYLLQRIPADMLILPEWKNADQWDSQILQYHQNEILRVSKDTEILWNDAVITIYASRLLESSNESSLCVLFHTEKCDILITGDRGFVGEEILLNTAEIPQLDALVVGHHGSDQSTGELLLEATRPKTALISVGEGNAYDHPADAVLERLRTYGCKVRRTDLEGTIIIRG